MIRHTVGRRGVGYLRVLTFRQHSIDAVKPAFHATVSILDVVLSIRSIITEWNLSCKVTDQFNIRASDMENM